MHRQNSEPHGGHRPQQQEEESRALTMDPSSSATAPLVGGGKKKIVVDAGGEEASANKRFKRLASRTSTGSRGYGEVGARNLAEHMPVGSGDHCCVGLTLLLMLFKCY